MRSSPVALPAIKTAALTFSRPAFPLRHRLLLLLQNFHPLAHVRLHLFWAHLLTYHVSSVEHPSALHLLVRIPVVHRP